MLGALSLISPDIITQDIFMVKEDLEVPEALKFCKDEDELDDIIKELLELALIKRDPTDDTMNIHRLVQDEFKGQLSDSHRQEAFNAAALLLYEAFPSQVKGELFDERMPICARYIQHVYWLRDYLNTAMDADKRAKRAPSIIPSTEYVKLMTNAAWYCAERQGHFELEAILENSFQAMITNGMKDTELLLWAHLCNSAGRLWGQRGQFERGEKYFMECLKIRKEKLGKGDENIAGLLSNLGNLNLSMARYDKALDYQKQALDWGVVGDHNEISLRAQSIITANTARVLTDMGRTEEAWAMFKIGDEMKQYKQLEKQPPYRLIYKGRLWLIEGNLEEAKKTIKTAQDVQMASSEGPTSMLVASCKYRLGSIALRENDPQTAIQLLQEARAILEVRQAPDCTKARVLYVLWKARSQAGFEGDDQETEFREMLDEAQKIRKELTGKGDRESDSEEAYDLLLDCQLR